MRSTTMMLRFLDLTLLLLMTFLMGADLTQEREVALPHGQGEAPQQAVATVTVYYDMVLVEQNGVTCSATTGEVLLGCLSAVEQAIVAPQPGVHVQRLVHVLDACKYADAACSVGRAP